ncbi:Vacuolar protein-sorting-associated protein 25 [Trichoderma lentiforme]|uniref:ESCRT-II complex subunit VPS25 n=1 Tax=Trichoderma lentiforme TaxID=1567552 RepID=A0A9P5CBH9_9HYPO|nr:Vacuolar protein-sorting-associated protein 25 [Trichoderma lentiforme]
MATTTSPPPPQPQPQSSSPSSPSSPSFPFPREYFFPAFFTRQTNITIHHAQLTKWSALILAYARHHRLFRITISAAAESDLFFNRGIDRRLSPPDIREVLDFMRKDGRAEFLRPDGAADASSSSASAAAAAGGDVVFLYWRKPEEWAALVEAFVEETAQKGSVLTVYELTEGENTRGTDMAEFHGMDNQVLMKALNILVKRGKAQIFGSEESLGVKFF